MIYFILAPSVQLVKIGFTDGRVEGRLSGVRMCSPVPVQVAATGEGSRRVEGWLHRIFAPLRSHGEWFRHEGPIVELLLKLAVRGPRYLIEYTKALPLETDPVDIHGTISGYVGRKCRCERCCAAWAEYHKNRRNRQRSKVST